MIDSIQIARAYNIRPLFTVILGITMALIFSCSSDSDDPSSDNDGSGFTSTSGTFQDSRDNKSYKWVKIGGQIWLAENLNVEPTGTNGTATNSACYDNKDSYCTVYGRLYDWATAMALPASCNTSSCLNRIDTKHRGICPQDWHIPSNADWNVLMKIVDPSCSDNSTCANAGTQLKAKSGWNDYEGKSGDGTDKFGFSALPGGYGDYNGDFEEIGNRSDWWNTNEDNNEEYSIGDYAEIRRMYHNEPTVQRNSREKSGLRSVRCVKD